MSSAISRRDPARPDRQRLRPSSWPKPRRRHTRRGFTLLAEGLRFPESPLPMSDGSVLVVEIAAGNLTRVAPDGRKTIVAHVGGGPNGAALGPDGAVYLCNNGGFEWKVSEGRWFPAGQAQRLPRWLPAACRARYREGNNPSHARGSASVERSERPRVRCGRRLLVHGLRSEPRTERGSRRTLLCDAGSRACDRSRLPPLFFPNGIGLSPDGAHRLRFEHPRAPGDGMGNHRSRPGGAHRGPTFGPPDRIAPRP